MESQRRPFPFFALFLLILAVAALLLLLKYASASLFSKDPANITLTAEDGVQLSWIVEKNVWHGVEYDREHTFVCYEKEGLLPSQIDGGSAVTITINGTVPDWVTLREYALRSNEQSIYGDISLLGELDFYFSGKSGSFTLPASDGGSVRGYLLTCTWGENTCEYGFVVQLLPNG